MWQKIKTFPTRSGTWIDKNFVKIHTFFLVGCIGYGMYNTCASTDQHWICWERAALFAFGFFNVSLLWTGLSERKSWTIAFEKKHSILKLVLLFVVVSYSFPKAYQAMNNGETITHLWFVFIMAAAFLKIDLLVKNEARERRIRTDLPPEIKQRIESIHDDFEKSVYFIDWPSVSAFFILLSTLWLRNFFAKSNQPTIIHENFVGGAIAFQLIASVVIFLFILKGINKRNFAVRPISTNPNTGSSEQSICKSEGGLNE